MQLPLRLLLPTIALTAAMASVVLSGCTDDGAYVDHDEELDFEDVPTPGDGKADVSVLEDHFGVTVERAGFDSVGGYLLASLGRVPVKGERFDVGDLAVEVLDAERRRVTRVRMLRRPADADTETAGA